MSLVLDALTAADCETARGWRNREEARLGLRTPYMLTAEMQAAFYRDVVCDRRADSRWFAVRESVDVVGWVPTLGATSRTDLRMAAMAGLTSISWEDGHAEISLIVDPARTGSGIGSEAVGLLLREAFGRLRMATVYGEVIEGNPAEEFWLRQAQGRGGSWVRVPRRKFWDGAFRDAILFWFVAPDGIAAARADRLASSLASPLTADVTVAAERFEVPRAEIAALRAAEREVDAQIMAHGGPVAVGMEKVMTEREWRERRAAAAVTPPAPSGKAPGSK